MKTYTTKSNAKRAAKKITEQIGNQIEEITFGPAFKGDKNVGIFITLSSANTREDWKDISERFTNASFSLLEKKVDTKHHEEVTGEKPETAARKNKSEVAGPCRLVWSMADEMEGARRKDVIAACVEAGVAFYTARTQYQLWKQANNK